MLQILCTSATRFPYAESTTQHSFVLQVEPYILTLDPKSYIAAKG